MEQTNQTTKDEATRIQSRIVEVIWTYHELQVMIWAVLSDEQMRKIWPFSLLNDEQMSNKVGVKHQPVMFFFRLLKIC